LTLERQALRHPQSTERKETPDYTTDCEVVKRGGFGESGDFGESADCGLASAELKPVSIDF
jgi:hypothetical protein